MKKCTIKGGCTSALNPVECEGCMWYKDVKNITEDQFKEYCFNVFGDAVKQDLHDIKNAPLDNQVGGSHYKDMKIQPIEFIMANDLNFCQGNIIKYICRYKEKNGLEDLNKVIHYVELLKDIEYGE
jgi:hypothetical protein